jgi:hypothetical protein
VRKFYRLAVCASLLIAGGVAVAADSGLNLTLSGYGTLGGTLTSDSSFAYIHDGTEFTGATRQLDVGLESRLGVQAVVDFGSNWSVTVQELARQRGSDEFSLGTEWLYLQYAPDSDWKLRLGRVALATFLFSDSREVGYAAPWFRAPNELYGAESNQYLDGVQAQWHHRVGPVGLQLSGSYGDSSADILALGAPVKISATNVYNLAVRLEYRDFVIRVSQTALNLPGVIPLSAMLTVRYTVKDVFDSAGLQYDNGKAIVLGEFARRKENNIPILGVPVEATKQWYVAGGWRFGKLTPLLIYGKYETDRSLLTPEAVSNGTWSASLRYDLVRNIALKAEVSRPQESNGIYWVTADPASSARVNVYSFGADFVF